MPSNNNLEDIQRRDEERIAQQRAEAYDLPYANLSMTPVQEGALSVVDEKTAREARIAVLQKRGDAIKVAVEDPKHERTKAVLENLKKSYKSVGIVVGSKSGLEDVWSRYPSEEAVEGDITGYVKLAPGVLERYKSKVSKIEDVAKLLNDVSQTNASRAFEVMLASALAFDATDIHIEPQKGKTELRMKIDGILYPVAELNEHLYKLILSRIKLLSELKLNVHNEPQEGRFSITFEEREIEVRTSILPSQYNEDIALRVLDPKFLLSLSELGMRPDLEEMFKKQLKEPQGFILITGPTGSGKTTTLYAGLNFLKEKELKIITIEDPIEYHLEGITQTQVNIKDDYTFEAGLRAILRQDPDIVLLSELRGIESAEPAMQAALAGRLVLSTLHTIDAAGTAPRLIDLGADPSTVSSALSASVAQRLVRRLCDVCKIERVLSKKELAVAKNIMQNMPENVDVPEITPNTKIYSAKKEGCKECRGTGYKGRIGLFEIIVANKEIKQKILEAPTEEDLRDFAREQGFTGTSQDAIIRILKGVTSFEEVKRVMGTLE